MKILLTIILFFSPILKDEFFRTAAITYFVSTSGNDGNTGTSGSPFLTLAKAESVVAAGDIVMVNAGTYNISGLTMSHSGASGSLIEFRANGAVTINVTGPINVTGQFRLINGFTVVSTAVTPIFTTIFISSSNNQVTNSTFSGAFISAVWIKSSANCLIQNVTVTQSNAGSEAYGLKVGEDNNIGGELADNNTLDNVRIIGTAVAGQHIHGVLFGGGGSGNVLKNSYFANTYYGLVDKCEVSTLCFNNVFNFSGSSLYVSIYDKGSTNSQYYNNTCRNTGDNYGFLIAPSDGGTPVPSGAVVKNNIFIKGPTSFCIFNASGVTNSFTSNYNCFQYSSGTIVFYEATSTTYNSLAAWQATGQDANSIAATPLFTNGSGTLTQKSDYVPPANSPVVNVGVAIAGRSTDGVGAPIVGTPDMGAMELQTTGTTGNVYWIATNGSDGNNGTSINTPWRNFERLNSVALVPGDVVNIRAGTYAATAGTNSVMTLINAKSGTAANHITIRAYPPDFPNGGRVVYNANAAAAVRPNGAIAIHTLDCSYIDFIGIFVDGPTQTVVGSYTACWWFDANTSHTDITATNCEAAHAETGFRVDNTNNATFTNCDAHEIDDPVSGGSTGNHNNSDGFSRTGRGNSANNTRFIGCRAWWCSDDGWDCIRTIGSITYDHCWSFYNGYRPGVLPLAHVSGGQTYGDGNGLKMGGTIIEDAVEMASTTVITRFVNNSICAWNYANGFDQNLQVMVGQLYNNFAYHNGLDVNNHADNVGVAGYKFGYWTGGSQTDYNLHHVFKNNASLGNQIDYASSDAGDWIQSNNTWNGLVTITAADFVSLDAEQLRGARQADGSLPIITFGHLVNGSDLIDAGVDVLLPFTGPRPDMGAFETTGVGNQSPTANAGLDKNITLPTNSVTQIGSGTDPDGTITAYLWTKISGPSTFTIANSTTSSTAINNLVAGTYVFQLQVTDNSGATATDQMTIVVAPAPNQLPVANAGADKNITLPTNSVTQAGSGTDADGTIVSYLWTKIAGPATFSIVSASSATTVINNLVAGTYVFRLTVTDNSSATATDDVTVTVNPAPNQSPSANAGADRVIQLPINTVTQTGSGTDPDGTIASYLWTQVSGPSTAAIVSATQATTAFNNLIAGTYVFNLRVTDNSGATANDQFSVLVTISNQSPTANAGANQTITLPTSSVTVTGTGTDVDGTVASYLWTKISGPATFTIVSAASASTVINNLVAGTYIFQLTVTDNQGATGTDAVQVLVNAAPPPNQLPIANAGVDKNITLPTNSVSQVGSGTDADGTVVSYAWTYISGPATFTIASPSSSTTIINNLVEGTYIFRLTVTDNQGAVGTDQMTLIVNPAPNQPPSVNAGADQALTLPTTSSTVTGVVSDDDGSVTSTTWSFISGPATPLIASPSALSTGVSAMTVAGSYQFRLSATDNLAATATDNMIIVVNPAPNVPPVSNAGADKNITLPVNSLTQVGSGTDADGTIVSYLWTRVSGPATFTIVSATQATTQITNLVQGTYVFNLRVTDNTGATANDQVTIVVNAALNIAPTANAGADKNITLPTSSITQVGSGTDPDGTITAYLWTKISGPATFNIVSATSATTVINNLVAGTYVFQLQVTDNQGSTATNTMQVIVNPAPNIAPTANAGIDQVITAPTSSVNVTGTGTDPDGTIAAYLWTQISGPNTANIVSPTSASTTINTLIVGVYVFRLRVTDNSGAQATNDMQVTVNAAPPPNQPPIANGGTDKNITLPTNSVSQVGSGTDADGTVVSYLWTKISGPTTFTIVSPTSATTTISNLVAGTYVFRLTVTDNVGATGTDDISIIVNPAPNQLPIANAGTDKNITLPPNSVTQVGGGTDADGTVVSYLWTKVSGPVTFTIATPASSTTVISGLVAGTYIFRLTVTDNSGGTATDDATIIVNPQPNVPPTVNAGPDQVITLPEDSSTFAGNAFDTDGTIASTTWTFINGPVTPTIETPGSVTSNVFGLSTAGSYSFKLTATDNSATSGSDIMIILVKAAPNVPPVSGAGADITATMPLTNNMITLSGTASDADGTVIGKLWTLIAGPLGSTIISPTQLTTGVNIVNAGTYIFRLAITDNTGTTTNDDVTVTIIPAAPVPTGPTANAGADQKVVIPFFSGSTAAVVTGIGTPGSQGFPIVSYTWTKVAGPSSSVIMSPNTSLTTLRSLSRGVYIFQLTVIDSAGNTATDTISIDVRKQWITIRHGKIIIKDKI